MAGRVRRVHLVQRHDQPVAEQPVPDAIDDRPGEEVALAGLQRQLHQLGPALNFGGGGGTLSLLGALEQRPSLSSARPRRRSRRSGSSTLPAGQEHHPGLTFDALGRLELDRAEPALAQEARCRCR